MVMSELELDHITAIVSDAEGAADALSRLLGTAVCGEINTPSMTIRTLRIGDLELHVNAPAGPGPVRDHYDRHGPSLHHVAVRIDHLDTRLVELERRGFRARGRPVETAPGVREVFLDPFTTGGLWIQLVERSPIETGGTASFDAAAVDALAQSGQP